jgi:RimJ/RimL family protein N-acetyltransferase
MRPRVPRALIDKGFTEFGVRRVVAETLAANWGSRRVLEKSGLIHVDTFASAEPDAAENAEHGHVVYELTRADWEARHRPVS